MDLTGLGVAETAEAIAGGEVSAIDVVESALAQIAATDAVIGAWVTVDADRSRARARALDEGRAAGRVPGPLHGVPIGIKDIIDVAGLPTTSGAAPFAHSRPMADARLVARLRAAGAVILGKTVATEFAYKDPAATTNPWSAEHTPGGSSSGSAAAVAARQVPVAIGTQTVGSILRPSAFCGVVGLKGAHGEVPLDGVLPLAPSLDHGGPIARSVADAALVESVLLGRPLAIPDLERPILATSHLMFDQASPELRAYLDATLVRFVDAGGEVVEVELPSSFMPLLDAGRVILEAEAAAVHEAWFRDHAGEYGPQIAGLVRAGLARSAADVARARAVRAAFRAAIDPLLEGVDALLSPVAPGPAPLRSEGTGDFMLCAPWSFAGVPSIALPTGVDEAGLPLAIQLVGAEPALERLLGAAAWCERVLAFDARPASPSPR
jgi:aspartyl-tRNA(Asn)/glutamyl-tRNA(Gln) amidotransferase subunit A